MTTVAEAVGRTLAGLGVTHAFGVVGSGNFHVTNALVAGGARFVAARHEGGAATMADAFARVSGTVAVLSVHQGCGLTNAMTGIAEAAKSRTPLLVLAAEVTSPTSNFFVDQPALARAVGADTVRVTSAAEAVGQVREAYRVARDERRTVLVNLPLPVQAEQVEQVDAGGTFHVEPLDPPPARPAPATADVAALASVLARAERPVLIAGRGARHARSEVLALAEACGALVATSMPARGLFEGDPWSLGVCGGFATDLTADLVRHADVVVGLGCSLTMWTTRHGRLLGPDATVVQVDVEADGIGRAVGGGRTVDLGVVGDTALTACAAAEALRRDALLRDGSAPPAGYRTPEVRERLAREGRWADASYEDWSHGEGDDARIDPRTLTRLLDELLPRERVVAVDSGNFMGYPSVQLSVPDEDGIVFTQAFQSIGLGLASAVGAALARPDRLPVAALGDGGVLMSAVELDTVRRLGLPMVVVVYDDSAYGAEVHHFTDGDPLDTVRFPDTDIAAVGAGYGFHAVTVRRPEDLEGLRAWLDGPRDRPVLLDAKVASPQGSWWLEEAFRGH